MKAARITQAFAVAFLAAIAGGAFAAEPSRLGQTEYRNSCAACHGDSATGNGAFGGMMTVRVPDLTVLSKMNNGIFPFERIYQTIDGTQAVKSHGMSEMPIWGQRYRLDAAKYYVDVPYDERAFVHVRILALTEYLSTVQVK